MSSSPWSSTDYALRWPRELVREELGALYSHPSHDPSSTAATALLLEEVFQSDVPLQHFGRVVEADVWIHRRVPPGQGWVEDFLNHLDEVREYRSPGPYWRDRHQRPRSSAENDGMRALCREVVELCDKLETDGYLAKEFPQPCSPDDETIMSAHDEVWETVRTRVGGLKLWPLPPEIWSPDTLFGVIEVYHDLVSRPRRRWDHVESSRCRHFEDFDTDSGRRVFRALINRLLADHEIELRLAADGPDEGRLVALVDEARADLVSRALRSPDAASVGRVSHAIAQFRARGTSEHDKRSAVLTLVGILEERRDLIKSELGRKDEGALFTLANEFAIRHQRRGQQSDYDPAFLDWMFWWYLATIELTDRIVARHATTTVDQIAPT